MKIKKIAEFLMQFNCKWNYCDQKQEIISNHLKSIKNNKKETRSNTSIKQINKLILTELAIFI